MTKYKVHIIKGSVRTFVMETDKDVESTQLVIFRSTDMVTKSVCKVSFTVENLFKIPAQFVLLHKEDLCSNRGKTVGVFFGWFGYCFVEFACCNMNMANTFSPEPYTFCTEQAAYFMGTMEGKGSWVRASKCMLFSSGRKSLLGKWFLLGK